MQEQRKMFIMYSITTISMAFMGIIIQVLKIPQQEYHIVASYFWGDIFNKHKQKEITLTFYRFPWMKRMKKFDTNPIISFGEINVHIFN